MPQRALERMTQRVLGRMSRDKEIVEKATAFCRAALDEDEVVRREHRHVKRVVPHPPGVTLAIPLHDVTPRRLDLDLDELVAAFVANSGPYNGTRSPVAYQHVSRSPAKGLLHCDIANGLEDRGLAHAIAAADHGKTFWVELEPGCAEIAEVRELEPRDVAQDTLTGMSRYW